MKKKVLYSILGLILGMIFPIFFILLDLQELQMKFNLKNFLFILSSQDLFIFSFIALPLTFMALGYLFVRLQENHKKLLQSEIAVETEKRKAERSGRLAMLGEMAASIAHEINNPLAIIDGMAMVLKKKFEKFSAEERADRLDKIIFATSRAVKIVQGLKRFAHSHEGEEFAAINVADIIAEAQLFCEDRLKNWGVDFRIEAGFNPQVECRASEIAQVLINLTVNGAQAILKLEGEKKWVEIKTAPWEYGVEITVTDAGHGIPLEVVRDLFNPFFTTKEVGEGTGLGLSISKGIIDGHQGELEYNERSAHTQFSIKLREKIDE